MEYCLASQVVSGRNKGEGSPWLSKNAHHHVLAFGGVNKNNSTHVGAWMSLPSLDGMCPQNEWIWYHTRVFIGVVHIGLIKGSDYQQTTSKKVGISWHQATQ